MKTLRKEMETFTNSHGLRSRFSEIALLFRVEFVYTARAPNPQTWRFKAPRYTSASFMDSRLVVFIGQMNTSLKQLLADLPCQHMRLAFVRRGVAHEPVLVEQGRRGHRFEHLLLLAKGKGG